ncbi:TonB-dependent receptor [Glacieibacterium frigidum]|nr:TonB-dependent receptor [Glacieibacterium frigidum]
MMARHNGLGLAAFRARLYATTFGIALAGMVPAAALAQQAATAAPSETAAAAPAADADDTVGEIVVTARQVSENLQKVPVSVGVIKGGRLEAMSVRSIIDLDAKVPSLSFGNQSVRLQPFLGIRGVGDFSRNPGFDNRAGIYLDGVFLGRSSTTEFPIFDIERVEVLRGPQGTLFGKDSLTGVISITSAKPSFEDGYRGTLRLGSRDLIEGNAFVNAPITDTLAVRVSFAAQSQDGYYRNLFNNKKLGSSSNVAGRVQLRYKSDGTTVDLALDGASSKSDVLLGGRPITGPGATLGLSDYQVNLNNSPTKDRSIYGVSLNIEHQFDNGLALTSISAFRRSTSDLLNIDFDQSPLSQGANNIRDRDRSFSQELRLASSSGGLFDYVLGAFYFSGSPSWNWALSTGPDFAVPALRGGLLTIHAKVDQEVIAGFGRATLRPLTWLSVDAGLRYGRTTKDVRYTQVPGILTGLGFANVPLYEDKLSSNKLSPLISVSVRPTETINGYALFSTGARPGGFNVDLTSQTNFTFGGLRFGGESVKNYETGLKTQFFNNRLRLNLAAYVMKFDDFQVSQLNSTTQTIGGVTSVVRFNTINNAAKVTSKGIEIDFEAVPVRGLNLSGGVGINSAKFDSFPNAFLIAAGPPPVFGNYDGNTLIEAPKFTASATASYKFDLSDRHYADTSLTYTYRGKSFSDPSNSATFLQDKSNLVNGRIGIGASSGRYEAGVFVKNLFDTKFVQGAGTSGLGFAYQALNEPRVVGVEFTIRN